MVRRRRKKEGEETKDTKRYFFLVSLSLHFVDVNDVDVHLPGLLYSVYVFFRDYKIPDGKPANKFAFEGKNQNKVRIVVLNECE
jgi:hypothetical protein